MPPVPLMRWCTLIFEYLRQFSKKFAMTLLLFLRGLGEDGRWKCFLAERTVLVSSVVGHSYCTLVCCGRPECMSGRHVLKGTLSFPHCQGAVGAPSARCFLFRKCQVLLGALNVRCCWVRCMLGIVGYIECQVLGEQSFVGCAVCLVYSKRCAECQTTLGWLSARCYWLC